MPCSSATCASAWLISAASLVPPVIPVISSGARSRFPRSEAPTSISATASSGSASCTRSTSSSSVVLRAYSTSACSHRSRCARLRSLIGSANDDSLLDDRDRQRQDARILPGGADGGRLGARRGQRNAAVATARTRRLGGRAGPLGDAHEGGERRGDQREIELVAEAHEKCRRTVHRIEERRRVTTRDGLCRGRRHAR